MPKRLDEIRDKQIDRYTKLIEFTNYEVNKVHNTYRITAALLVFIITATITAAYFIISNKIDDINTGLDVRAKEIFTNFQDSVTIYKKQFELKMSDTIEKVFQKNELEKYIVQKTKGIIGEQVKTISGPVVKATEEKMNVIENLVMLAADRTANLEYTIITLAVMSGDFISFKRLTELSEGRVERIGQKFVPNMKNLISESRSMILMFEETYKNPDYSFIRSESLENELSKNSIQKNYELYIRNGDLNNKIQIINFISKNSNYSVKVKNKFYADILRTERDMKLAALAGNEMIKLNNLSFNPIDYRNILQWYEAK